MKQADIFMFDTLAGQLTEDEDGYTFVYEPDYILQPNAQPISLTLPLGNTQFKSPTLFPFFDGLIPEGWLLDIATENWKISSHDRMSLLLACCKDCIGAVSVIPSKSAQDE